MKNTIALATALACSCLVGCTTARPSPITPGVAKKYIQPGATTQTQIIEVFGSPNIVTRRDGCDEWVYDKVSSRQSFGVFGMGGLGGGLGSGGAGGGLLGGGMGSTTRSETTVMLIVYFDRQDVVRDYKITQTKF